jgi:hypothetical protein
MTGERRRGNDRIYAGSDRCPGNYNIPPIAMVSTGVYINTS